MNKKIILDLCGGTGTWSEPYKNAGYDVRNITLPNYDIRTYKPPKNVYGILAAPPCTEFSVAKNGKRDFPGALEIVRACLDIIWEYPHLHFWALENPRGMLSRFLGRAPYYFEQWEFGGNRRKPTALWGRFDKPKKTVFIKPEILAPWPEKGEVRKTRAQTRAITPPGFARAFFLANK